MNTSSLTFPFVELFNAFAAKAVKEGNHAEVTANQLKERAKEYRMAKVKEFCSWLDNKTIIFDLKFYKNAIQKRIIYFFTSNLIFC